MRNTQWRLQSVYHRSVPRFASPFGAREEKGSSDEEKKPPDDDEDPNGGDRVHSWFQQCETLPNHKIESSISLIMVPWDAAPRDTMPSTENGNAMQHPLTMIKFLRGAVVLELK